MNAPRNRVFGVFSIGRKVLTWDGQTGEVIGFVPHRVSPYEVLIEPDRHEFYRAEALELQDSPEATEPETSERRIIFGAVRFHQDSDTGEQSVSVWRGDEEVHRIKDAADLENIEGVFFPDRKPMP